MKLPILVAATLLVAHAFAPAQVPVAVTLQGSLVTTMTAGGVTTPAAALLTGTSNAYGTLAGSGADADNLDLSSYFAKNGNDTRWEVDFGAWTDTNGGAPDFFVFEAGGNDIVTVEAWLAGGGFGLPVSVPLSAWAGTGYTLTTSPNANQQIFGFAISVTDLLDAGGGALMPSTVLKGIRIGSPNIDGCSVSAVNPGGAVNLPPVANAGTDRTIVLPASAATLDGSASFDPDGQGGTLTTSWSQVSGPSTAMFSNSMVSMPVVSGLVEGTYRFQLTVTDAGGASDTDDVNVFVIPTAGSGGVSGELKKWHRVSVSFAGGPATSETATPNPFLDYRLDVTFTHTSSQKSYVVPGFYAADGNAAITHATAGSVWRVHFTPDEIGQWTYIASFVTGTDIAVASSAAGGTSVAGVHGSSGTIMIAPTDKVAPDHRGRGLLKYQGRHHLVYAETGEEYLKGGADSPENLLGYFGFDGTFDTGGLSTPGLINGLHRFAPHAGDWNPGDPNWVDEQGDEGKNFIGALNYLGTQGVNSAYFLTYNVDGGDGRDTWPWIATAPAPPTNAQKLRFDCSKLDQWEIAFSHMDTRGIQLHVVTQETENDGALDGGTLGTTRRLYYRELVARFGHHLAVIWNLGEENNNGAVQLDLFANYIRSLDVYEHPITVHTNFNAINSSTGLGNPYTGLYGNNAFEASSLQGNGTNYNGWARNVRLASAAAGQPWVVFGDEQGPAVDDNLNNLATLRTRSLWGNLIGGGGGVEWYFGYQGTFGDVQSEDWRQVEALWEDTRHAIDFFKTHTRFFEMEGRNDLVSGIDYALAAPGEEYALFIVQAGSGHQLDLEGSTDSYTVGWFNPRTGAGLGALQVGTVSSVTGPGMVDIGSPPVGLGADWACYVRNENIEYLGGGVVSSDDVIPQIRLSGSPTIPAPTLTATVEAPAGATAALVVNFTTTNVPIGTGSLLVLPLNNLFPFTQVLVSGASGAAFPLMIPAEPMLAGVDLFIQGGYVDTATETGLALTDAMRLRLHF